jgi:hypothetical protein
VLASIALILAGVGLLLTASPYRDVAGRFARWRLEVMRERRTARALVRVAEWNARWGPAGAVWLGRSLGIAAIVVGIVLLVRG